MPAAAGQQRGSYCTRRADAGIRGTAACLTMVFFLGAVGMECYRVTCDSPTGRAQAAWTLQLFLRPIAVANAYRTSSISLRGQHDAKADIVAELVWVHILAHGDTHTAVIIAPTSTAHGNPLARDDRRRVRDGATGQATIVAIQGPLSDIAMHIIQPEGIRRKGSHRERTVLLGLARRGPQPLAEITDTPDDLGTETICAGGSCPRRILPLRLGRQSIDIALRQAAASPLPFGQAPAKRAGLLPADGFDRPLRPREERRRSSGNGLILGLRGFIGRHPVATG